MRESGTKVLITLNKRWQPKLQVAPDTRHCCALCYANTLSAPLLFWLVGGGVMTQRVAAGMQTLHTNEVMKLQQLFNGKHLGGQTTTSTTIRQLLVQQVSHLYERH